MDAQTAYEVHTDAANMIGNTAFFLIAVLVLVAVLRRLGWWKLGR